MEVDLIKQNKMIKLFLLKRIKTDLKISFKTIENEALRLKMKGINKSSISKYFKGDNIRGSLSQKSVLWLCVRYGIEFTIKVKELAPYNEKECLENLKEYGLSD
jgi:hypothetical protein